MLNTILFSDEITLWWDKQWELRGAVTYRATLNGEAAQLTPYTHVTFRGLTPETEYTVRVDRVAGDAVLECLGTLTLVTPPAKRRIDVTAAPYFAVPDGETLNTEALRRAIADCGKDDCVYFPKGVYLTGALDLHSDMELYLDEGAVLQGTARVEDYLPKRPSRFEGIEMECYSSLLNIGTLDHKSGPNCRNIVLRGGGSILGGGVAHAEAVIEVERELLRDFLAANEEYVKTCENDRTIPGRARPRLVNISNGESIVIANLTLGFAASWNIHFIYSRDIVTYGCRILSEGVWNGDGWDPDSSDNSVIFDTEFRTHDNSIAIKSGKNPEGNLIARPTVGVRIFHCSGSQCMAVGSEMSGGVSDVFIWDCDFTRSGSGIGLKVTGKRGGYIRNVRVRDSRFVNLRARSVTFNDDGEPADTVAFVEDILFEDVEFTGIHFDLNGNRRPTELLYVVGLEGEENYFRRFTFDGVRFPARADGGTGSIQLRNVSDLTLKGLTAYPEEK